MIHRIAVLMSTYNGEKYIKCQIDSILNQDLDNNLKLIIRDDGSSDGTVDIIKAYQDERIELHCGKNIGINRSFFELIQLANHQTEEYSFFSFSDQDDQWDSDKLRIAINCISAEKENSKPLLYCSASLHVDENLNPTEPKNKRIIKPLLLYNTIIQTVVPGHTYVFNRNLLNILSASYDIDRVNLYDSFILNIANICGKVIYDPNRHTNYRQHSGNACGFTENFLKWGYQRLRRHFNGETKRYARQIEYIYELFHDSIPAEEKCEIQSFLASRNTFISRARYIIKSKFYRQKEWQTYLFRIIYLLGGYNT